MKAMVALEILQDRESEIDMVVTEAHLEDMNRYQILEEIRQISPLPIVFLSNDNEGVAQLGSLFKGAEYCISKPLSETDAKNLWQFSYLRKKEREANMQETGHIRGGLLEQDSSKRKDKEPMDGNEEEGSSIAKRQKMYWSDHLQEIFVQIIQMVGIEDAQKILEIMNVPRLTLENVESHIQEYLRQLRMAEEEIQRANAVNEQSLILTSNLEGGIGQFPLFEDHFQLQNPNNNPNPVPMPAFTKPQMSGDDNQHQLCPTKTSSGSVVPGQVAGNSSQQQQQQMTQQEEDQLAQQMWDEFINFNDEFLGPGESEKTP